MDIFKTEKPPHQEVHLMGGLPDSVALVFFEEQVDSLIVSSIQSVDVEPELISTVIGSKTRNVP